MSMLTGNPSFGDHLHEATSFERPGRPPGRSERKVAEDAAFKGTVLIYRLGSLGDTVVSLPCFHKIAERFPNARRLVLTNRPVSGAAPRLSDILGGSGLVHETIEYRISLRSPVALARLWLQLRRSGSVTLCYLAAPRGRIKLFRDLAFFRSCGIRRVIGAPRTSDLQNWRSDPKNGEDEYECERLARCIAELGPVDLDRRSVWDLGLSEHEREAGLRVLQPFNGQRFIAVNMGGKAAENDWGEPNWRELFAYLRRDWGDLRIVVVGGGSDAQRADSIAGALGNAVLNLCGRLSPRGTAAVLSRASLFIGHDSGPLHLASACGVPCVGIFSNRHKPHKWHPYGRSHRIVHPSGPISTVSVTSVSEAVASAIRAASQADREGSVGSSMVVQP